MIWSMINICLKFLYMIQHEHWQYADNITLVWNIVIHIWRAWIVFDNMQRAEASELIRLMTSSRAVCSREEHGTDKCQNISPILSTYWHCSMFKNNLAVLAFGLHCIISSEISSYDNQSQFMAISHHIRPWTVGNSVWFSNIIDIPSKTPNVNGHHWLLIYWITSQLLLTGWQLVRESQSSINITFFLLTITKIILIIIVIILILGLHLRESQSSINIPVFLLTNKKIIIIAIFILSSSSTIIIIKSITK